MHSEATGHLPPVTARMHAGGHMACSGPQCRVVFSNVTLEGCVLELHRGVNATIHGLCARQARHHGHPTHVPHATVPSLRYALHVWEAARSVRGGGSVTTVHATSMTLDRGVFVSGGARFTGERVNVMLGPGGEHGVVAKGEGTHVTLQDSEIALAMGVTPAGHDGVVASAKARIDMTGSTVRQVYTGMKLSGGSRACLRGCRVHAEEDGVWAMGAETRLSAQTCQINGHRTAVRAALVSSVSLRDSVVGKVKRVCVR